MRAVVTVIGKDMVGILGKVATRCADFNANVTEVTQSVLQDVFAMIMMVDIKGLACSMPEFEKELSLLGEEIGLSIHVMHEDIFNSMHRI